MARTLDVACSEIHRDRLQRWDEMDITLLFESILGEWWLVGKENSCTSQWSNVSVHVLFWKLKEKFMKMRQQWDNKELKEATTTWSNDWDHDSVQEEVEGKLRQQRWRYIVDDIHTHEGRTSRIARWSSSPSTPSIMLSMGEDFVDKEERSHGVR